MQHDFTDRVVLVTGGGSGIGRATALAFARAGATVAVAGRDEASLDDTARLAEKDGATVSTVPCDVTREDDTVRMVDTVVRRHGGLHVAVNNAGTFGVPGPAADLDARMWSTVLATNLTGVWLSLRAQVRHMRTAGGGVIVNVASNIGAHLRLPGLSAYAASKAGVSALTRSAALDHIGEGVRINAVSPGPIATAMSRLPGETDAERDARVAAALPAGRIGTPEEVAASILWLASPASAFVVGQDVVVDGGATA